MAEFHPRDGDVEIEGIPWLARCIDKARAKVAGEIGEYIFPCPVDRRLLDQYGTDPKEFTELVTRVSDDREIARELKARRSE